MNWTQAEEKWNRVKGPAKTNWGRLTDDDLNRIGGRKDTLVDVVQERYGIGRHEAAQQVDIWIGVMHARHRMGG